MKISALAGSVAIIAAISSPAFAQSTPNPYRDCGIGAAIFSDNGTAAAISNVIWDLGTTALSSATITPESCTNNNAQAAVFIFETYDILVEESARGQGDSLLTLLDIMEVAPEERNEVISALRVELSAIVAKQDYQSNDRLNRAEAYYHSLVKVTQQAG